MDLTATAGAFAKSKASLSLTKFKKAAKKVIVENVLEQVKPVVEEEPNFLEENLSTEEPKIIIPKDYIGDKGGLIKSAKELLFGERSKKF
jgi:hypothetical protein